MVNKNEEIIGKELLEAIGALTVMFVYVEDEIDNIINLIGKVNWLKQGFSSKIDNLNKYFKQSINNKLWKHCSDAAKKRNAILHSVIKIQDGKTYQEVKDYETRRKIEDRIILLEEIYNLRNTFYKKILPDLKRVVLNLKKENLEAQLFSEI